MKNLTEDFGNITTDSLLDIAVYRKFISQIIRFSVITIYAFKKNK